MFSSALTAVVRILGSSAVWLGDGSCEVDGVSGMMSGGGNVSDLMKKNPARGVKISCNGESITLDLFVTVQYGHPIPEMAQNVQQAVATAVADSTGFTVSAVNVHVGGISIA